MDDLAKQIDLETALVEAADDFQKKILFENYVDERESKGEIALESVVTGYKWLNTKENPTLNNLLGRIVVLDFFTYCCINCMHILPVLHDIEKEFAASRLVVLGIHSAKFQNEKLSSNVLNAIDRYGIKHPVLNDPEAKLWQKFGIQCWPTLVIIGPTGRVLFQIIGEGERAKLFEYCRLCIDYYESREQFGNIDLQVAVSKVSDENILLRFPSKLSVSPNGNLVAVSTLHRIIIVNRVTNTVEKIVGAHEAGNMDGKFNEAKFNSPQGSIWTSNTTLYVADTQNHTIRQISLDQGDVTTVVGTGHQATDYVGGKIGTSQGISSPWDFSFNPKTKDVLFIAMAGTHQIWLLFLEDTKWTDSLLYEKWTCKVFAGSGVEGNRNNRYLKNATFAQPSGLCFSECLSSLFVADSESSSVRAIDLDKAATKGIVGGDRDPNNLFSYGDNDGTGIDAKLQHPLGVSWSEHNQRLYVADSYNHKIKVVNIETKTCTTLECDIDFNEPGGLCILSESNSILVADTNNHRIVSVGLTMLKAHPLLLSETEKTSTPSANKQACQFLQSKDTLRVNHGSTLNLTIVVQNSQELKLNNEAPHFWSITKTGSVKMNSDCGFEGTLTGTTTNISLLNVSNNGILEISACVYACSEDDGKCVMKEFQHKIEIITLDESNCNEIDSHLRNITITWSLGQS